VPKKLPPPPPPLTGKQRSYLRALAHAVKPVVRIGHQGVTPGVLSALGVALDRHELIKVKVAGEAEVDAQEIGPELERSLRCQVAQVIGHTLVLYRRREKDPKIVLPVPSKPRKSTKLPGQAVKAAAPAAFAIDDDADDPEDYEEEE
jgi:RNA-binding protein